MTLMGLIASKDGETIPRNGNAACPLTIFTFLWAAQAIVHQEYFVQSWIVSSPALGWTLTILAWATLLWSRSLLLLTAMLTTSVIFNVVKWPYVVNHILVETVINCTILLAIASVWVPLQRTNRGMDPRARQAIFDRFAPVVGTMLVLVYYFALLAKLNTDFLISETSCTTILNRDLLNLFPFLPDTDLTKVVVIWATLLVEFSIPVLLTFRRTRYAAILLGLGFHFMLGLIGHRTFSALAFALYILYCIGPVTSLLNYVIRSVRTKRDPDAVKRYLSVARVVALLIGLLFVVELTGNYPPESGPLSIARVDWAFWLFGSATVALVYVSAIVLSWLGRIDLPRLSRVGRPGLLWLMVLLVVLNGMAQYIGLKTKTSFTMYSNLRTEGEYNNHLFMPAWRVAGYQDDLVDIVKTDHPRLQVYIDRKQYITYFEFRRLVSTTRNPFHVTYLRGDTSYEFALRDGVSTDAELSQEYPTWLSKLLYFRPISKGEVVRCLH